MSKRGRKEEKPFGMKWTSRRVAPVINGNGEIINAMDATYNKKDKICTLDDFIYAEKPVQMRVFEVIGCDKELSKRAWEAIELAYTSALKEDE